MRKRNFTKQVGLILTEEIYNRLIEQTDKEEVTISEWIREAIETRLAKEARHKWSTKEQPKEDH